MAIIPARFGSTRLPGKPMLDRTGKPLVVHVAEQASRAAQLCGVMIATDDDRIAEAARAHGQSVVMTRADHPNGTSRIAEAAAGLPQAFQIIVNVQGDEPEIDPVVIDRLIERLRQTGEPMATVAAPFAADEDPADPNIVKVVVDQKGRAMYFSRSLIPHLRDGRSEADGEAPRQLHFKHLGIYAYRRRFLAEYVRLPATPLEQAEKLEQLRVIEHGHAIAVIRAESAAPGIDTPEQYEAFVQRHRQR